MRLINAIRSAFTRGPRRPLAKRMPTRDEMGQRVDAVPLGMEATDIAMVEQVARKNDALERTNALSFHPEQDAKRSRSTHVQAMPDDETYAARYHRAFNGKGQSDE